MPGPCWGQSSFQGHISWHLHSAWAAETAAVVVAAAARAVVAVDGNCRLLGGAVLDSHRKMVEKSLELIVAAVLKACAIAFVVQRLAQGKCSGMLACAAAKSSCH